MRRGDIPKILFRLGLLVGLAFLFNLVYTKYYWEDDKWEYGQMLADIQSAQQEADIIYFGESSNNSYHPVRDSLVEKISEFIAYHYPSLSTIDVTHAGYHAGLYQALVKRIEAESKVQTVVVTMNLRTFDQAVTHSPLETAMQQEKVLFGKRPALLSRLLLTLNYFDNKTELERDRIKWAEWTYDTLVSSQPGIEFPHPTIRSWCEQVKFPREDGSEDMPKRSLADHYIKAYAFQLDDENPRIKDFDKIQAHCKATGKNLVLNLLAENMEYADSLVGKNLLWLMEQNRDYLLERYTNSNTVVVDNLGAVGGFHFTDQTWTTEHYDQYGRQVIARNVAIGLRKWHDEFYRAMDIRQN